MNIHGCEHRNGFTVFEIRLELPLTHRVIGRSHESGRPLDDVQELHAAIIANDKAKLDCALDAVLTRL
jgi:hypothetical protein